MKGILNVVKGNFESYQRNYLNGCYELGDLIAYSDRCHDAFYSMLKAEIVSEIMYRKLLEELDYFAFFILKESAKGNKENDNKTKNT